MAGNSSSIIGDVFACVGFYTRFPVRVLGGGSAGFAEAQWATPVAGIFVAAIGALVYAAADLLGLPPQLAAALALASLMTATGCLHEDGLADTLDGFGGGATRERKLEIMKDSHNGSFGTAGLIVTILVRWSAIAFLATPTLVFCALLAAHAASRMLFPLFMNRVPPAKPTGLAAQIGRVPEGSAMIAIAIGMITLFATLGFWPAVLAALLLALWFAVLKHLTTQQIGGHTGDVLGALQQGAEIIILLVAAAVFS